MKKFVLIALACFVAAGCKKAIDSLEKQGYESGHQKDKSKPEINDFANPGAAGGGGGGAVQAVRGAVSRAELENALHQIKIYIENASAVDGTMPAPATTYAALQREAPKYAKYIADQHIVLNQAQTRDDVWAWAVLPQGNYAVLTSSGIQRMTQQELNQRLGR